MPVPHIVHPKCLTRPIFCSPDMCLRHMDAFEVSYWSAYVLEHACDSVGIYADLIMEQQSGNRSAISVLWVAHIYFTYRFAQKNPCDAIKRKKERQ